MGAARQTQGEIEAQDLRLVDAALALVNARPSAEPIGDVRYGKGPYATWTRAFVQRVGKSPRKPRAPFGVSDVETLVTQVLVLVARGSGPLGPDQAHAIVRLTGLSEGLTVAYLSGLTEKNRASGVLFERLKDLCATAGAMEAADLMHDVPAFLAVLNGLGQAVARSGLAGQVGRLRALDALLTGIEHNLRTGAAAAEAAGQTPDAIRAEQGLDFYADEPPPPPPPPRAVPLPPPPASAAGGVEAIEDELRHLVGAEGVKREFRDLVDRARLMATRKEVGLKPFKVSRHFAFMGNPGTGRSTVAGLLSRVYGELGLLTRGHLAEVGAADLVDASGPGLTPARTREAMEAARGGILYVDRAHLLGSDQLGPNAREAVEALVRVMRDPRCDIVLVLAGAAAPMQEFLKACPAVAEHAPSIVRFPDHDLRDMVAIVAALARNARCEFDEQAKHKVLEAMGKLCADRGEGFANARLARGLFDAAVSVRNARLASGAGGSRGQAVTADDVSAAWVSVRLA